MYAAGRMRHRKTRRQQTGRSAATFGMQRFGKGPDLLGESRVLNKSAVNLIQLSQAQLAIIEFRASCYHCYIPRSSKPNRLRRRIQQRDSHSTGHWVTACLESLTCFSSTHCSRLTQAVKQTAHVYA